MEANPQLESELAYDTEAQQLFCDDACGRFNEGQSAVFNEIVAAIEATPQEAHFFIQGPGGTGKTFLYKALAAHFRALGRVTLCVASSGIAALLLPGGRTAHSRFKIPLAINESSTCNIKKNSKLAAMIRATSLIIWDEVPMQNKYCFEAVDRTLRDVLDVDSLFGGIPTAFGGDFAQILPVVRRGARAQIVQASLSQSYIWPAIRVRCLTENMRVQGSDEDNRGFIQWLQDLPYNPELYGLTELYPAVATYSSITDFFSAVYPDELLASALFDPGVFADRCILTGTNTAVAELNFATLRRFPGDSTACLAVTTVVDGPADVPVTGLSPEFLQSVEFPSIAPSRLDLKFGVPVILMRNLDAQQGLCNGTRMVVLDVRRNCLKVRVLTGDFAGEIRYIPRIKLTTSPEDFAFIISRVQFPVRLCFAMTINKSQGQSFTRVGVDLRSPVFSHGQFYVAMSRVTDVRGLHVLLPGEGARVMNVVYPEVLITGNSG